MAPLTVEEATTKLLGSALLTRAEVEEIRPVVDSVTDDDSNAPLLRALFEKEITSLGLYFEDVDGLWNFEGSDSAYEMPPICETLELQALFDEVKRDTTPPCYISATYNVYIPPSILSNNRSLPLPWDASAGTNKTISNVDFDIVGKPYNHQRAHNAPDSKTCCPSWGHVAEGVLGPVLGANSAEVNQKRKLLIMGKRSDRGKSSLRFSPFNFLRFVAHKEYYDTNPQVFMLPILSVDDIKVWDNIPYDVLLICGKWGDKSASTAYVELLGHYRNTFGKSPAECRPSEIGLATTSLRKYMQALAASLMLNVPIDLAATTEKQTELEHVRDNIKINRLKLPSFSEGSKIRPVMKLRFESRFAGDPIPDPWLLLAKGATNMSWILGQKLLPACTAAGNDYDDQHPVWQNLEDFRRVQLQKSIPTTLSVPVGSVAPSTPKNTHSNEVVATPPSGPVGFVAPLTPKNTHSNEVVVTPPSGPVGFVAPLTPKNTHSNAVVVTPSNDLGEDGEDWEYMGINT